MIDKIIHTIKAFGLQNNEGFLAAEEKAEMEAEITYLEKMKDFSYVREIENLKSRIDMLQEALLKITSEKKEDSINKDIRISRKDFVTLWEKCTENNKDGEFRYEDLVYGKNVTVHWNGFYCDCVDGAVAYNNIITSITSVDDEEGDGV